VFSFVAAEKATFPISLMCRALGVNRTSFHDWERRAPSDRALGDAWLTERIKQVHAESDGTYGARRIHAELRMEHGIRVGRKRVERLMKAAGISGGLPRKRRRTTVRLPGVRVAPDLLERDFDPTGPNQTWSADITYISTWEGFLYLAHVQDLYSRRIVGWSMADHLRSELVVDALEMALARRRPDSGVVHHSDQGCPVHRGAVHQALRQGGDRSLDGLPRRLFRQRLLRDFPRNPQEGTHLPPVVGDPRRGALRDLRIHRELVQPPPPALHARLSLTSRVRATPGRARSTRARDRDFGR
jgi:putative transposase